MYLTRNSNQSHLSNGCYCYATQTSYGAHKTLADLSSESNIKESKEAALEEVRLDCSQYSSILIQVRIQILQVLVKSPRPCSL